MSKPPAGESPPPPRRQTSSIEDTAIIDLPKKLTESSQVLDRTPAPEAIGASGDEVDAFRRDREATAARMNTKAKRTQQRVNLDLDIKVVFKYVAGDGMPDLDRIYEGMLTDISTGGTSFIGKLDPSLTPEPLKDGRYLIGMNLCLPFIDKPVKILGQAMRVSPSEEHPGEYEYGIKFLNPNPDSQALINSFLISLQMGGRKKLRP